MTSLQGWQKSRAHSKKTHVRAAGYNSVAPCLPGMPEVLGSFYPQYWKAGGGHLSSILFSITLTGSKCISKS